MFEFDKQDYIGQRQNGLARYYRDHIPHFASIIAALTELTKKG